MAHPSGICRYPKCDREQLIDGYCTIHHQAAVQKETKDALVLMTKVLLSVDQRLQNIEVKFSQPQQVIEKEVRIIEKSTESVDIKPQTQDRPSSIFVPSVNLSENQPVIRDVKRDNTVKSIKDLAAQLDKMS